MLVISFALVWHVQGNAASALLLLLLFFKCSLKHACT
jgi:hypothetical protein